MLRIFCIFLSAVLLLLTACSRSGDAPEQPAANDVVVTKSGENWSEDRLVLGRQTYEAVCSDCHDSGKMDAPLIGNPKDWSGRSELWEAVLFEHAKSGYMEMPGAGGQENISDEAVEAAAEYMLSITFPDMLRD